MTLYMPEFLFPNFTPNDLVNRLVICRVILQAKLPVCLFVSMGVRGKPRVYCSLLTYCTSRFGRFNFRHQMSPRLPTRSAL
jgi:hypothetical protein